MRELLAVHISIPWTVSDSHNRITHAMSLLAQLSVASIILLCLTADIISSQNLGSSYFFYQQPNYPRDCKEAKDVCNTKNSSGVFLIKPDGYNEPFEVYCDNEIDSGGWTVIQRRENGAVTFQRDWLEYKLGFGFLSQEFYLGNEKLSYLTNQNAYQLLIEFTYGNGSSYYAMYTLFRISDEFSGYTMTSVGQYSGTANFTNDQPGPIDCLDVYQRGNIESSVYYIKPTTWNGRPFQVYCNMTDGGGWTVFQRRVDRSVEFFLYWEDYKNGFGNQIHEHWLGNEKLFSLTNQRRYALRVDLVNSGGNPYFAKCDFFRINNEVNNYRLTVGTYSDGEAGDALTAAHNNQDFSTRDRDNDDESDDHIANYSYNGAWWWGRHCSGCAFLNGDYIYWVYYYHQFTEMKLRPV